MPEKYEPCEICGYGLYTEKHHPHGRERVLLRNKDGEWLKINVTEADCRKALGERIFTADIYIFPKAVVYLCPNCHIQFTRFGTKLSQIITKVTEHHRKIREGNGHIATGAHIHPIGLGYNFCFDKEELIVSEVVNRGCGPNSIVNMVEYSSQAETVDRARLLKEKGW